MTDFINILQFHRLFQNIDYVELCVALTLQIKDVFDVKQHDTNIGSQSRPILEGTRRSGALVRGHSRWEIGFLIHVLQLPLQENHDYALKI